MTKNWIIFSVMILTLVMSAMPALAEEDDEDDIYLFGLELEKLLSLFSGIMAAVLTGLAFLAYKRLGRKRLLFVCAAFGLYALKSFLLASELFIQEIPALEPITSALDFAILLCFFTGLLKK